MELVLGLAVTSTAVRWVLAEGMTGEGAPVAGGVREYAALDDFDDDAVLDAVLDGMAADQHVHAVGLTWTDEVQEAAGTLLQALFVREFANVIAVSDAEAADALASGIADVAGYRDVAVCIVEPDVVVVAVVGPGGVAVDKMPRSRVGTDDVELASSVITMVDPDDRGLDAIFVVGSADVEEITTSLEVLSMSPVVTAADADLAFARGAALAAARAVNNLDADTARTAPRWLSRVGALTSVLAAAVVVFVVSLSVALGLRLTPQLAPEQSQTANAAAAGAPAQAASLPAIAEVKPLPPPVALPPEPVASPPEPPQAPPLAETIAVAAPPPPEAIAPIDEAPIAPPAYEEPGAPAYVPPVPANVPPPAPPPTYQQPRLRDRIIERIPIINRFHEPEPSYPNR